MSKINKSKLLLLLFLLLVFNHWQVVAQLPMVEIATQYQHFVGQNDSLIHAHRMQVFFDKLKILEQRDSGIVRIVHVGDSHTQADMMTGVMRQLFQHYFGNAGRGLLAPLRLANTNEPTDYRLSSNNQWESSSIRKPHSQFSPGVAALSVATRDTLITLKLKTNFRNDTANAFNAIGFIGANYNKFPLVFVKDSLQQAHALAVIDNETMSTIVLPQMQNEVEMFMSNDLRIDGMVLTNGKNGVLYHNIGVNGAHISDYNRSVKLFEQLQMLQPDLVIVSLGSNEGVNKNITVDAIVSDLEMLKFNFEQAHVQAPLLLLTPFDNYYRRKTYNQYLAKVRRGMLQFASKQSVALVDMYAHTGGYKSAAQWRKHGLMRPDGVHYTRQGYELQAQLVFNVLMKNYLKYAH